MSAHGRSRPAWPLAVAAALIIAGATTAVAMTVGGGDGTGPEAARQGAAVDSARPRCSPRRQLRGVWITTVRNMDWPSKTGLSPSRQRAEYVRILDAARARNLNAVFVHIRPMGDAVYRSPYEPWSQFLTGKQGKNPGWDPLPFLIREARERGLEFHAWFNPYRVSYGTKTSALAEGHPARRNPGWTVKHKGRLYYNPGLPAVRDHVTKVISDVVRRYDVDAVHFDDYFYPYEGGDFRDRAAHKKHGRGKSLAGWRRDNVNRLVRQVSGSVHAIKPYVKFGISPFGIWRNRSTDPSGSATAGLQGYDNIFADARTWIRKGWIDYIVPQLYWPIGQRNADYATLAKWWAKEVRGSPTQLYIGQALYQVGTSGPWKKPGELPRHLRLNRKYREIQGDVYFTSRMLLTNPLGVLDRIEKKHYARPALRPLMKRRGGAAPPAPSGVTAADGRLTWRPSKGAAGYAVYRATGENCELVAVVRGPAYAARGRETPTNQRVAYHVAALDRLQNQSRTVRAG